MKATKKQNTLFRNPVFLFGVLLVVVLGFVCCDYFFTGHHEGESSGNIFCHFTAFAGIVTTPSFLFFAMALFVIFSINQISNKDNNGRNSSLGFILLSSLLIVKIFNPILRAFRKGILNPQLYNPALVTG